MYMRGIVKDHTLILTFGSICLDFFNFERNIKWEIKKEVIIFLPIKIYSGC